MYIWSLYRIYALLVITHREYGQRIKKQVFQVTTFFHYYSTVIRPVLEYCVPVWHYALTKAQTEQIEAVQKRAILAYIILIFFSGHAVHVICSKSDYAGLSQRRIVETLRKFFLHISEPTSCLHHLLP